MSEQTAIYSDLLSAYYDFEVQPHATIDPRVLFGASGLLYDLSMTARTETQPKTQPKEPNPEVEVERKREAKGKVPMEEGGKRGVPRKSVKMAKKVPRVPEDYPQETEPVDRKKQIGREEERYHTTGIPSEKAVEPIPILPAPHNPESPLDRVVNVSKPRSQKRPRDDIDQGLSAKRRKPKTFEDTNKDGDIIWEKMKEEGVCERCKKLSLACYRDICRKVQPLSKAESVKIGEKVKEEEGKIGHRSSCQRCRIMKLKCAPEPGLLKESEGTEREMGPSERDEDRGKVRSVQEGGSVRRQARAEGRAPASTTLIKMKKDLEECRRRQEELRVSLEELVEKMGEQQRRQCALFNLYTEYLG